MSTSNVDCTGLVIRKTFNMIYKYPILQANEGHTPTTTKEVVVPGNSQFLSVVGHNGGIVAFFDVNPDFKNYVPSATETWIFKVVWTGMGGEKSMAFAGTVAFDSDEDHQNYGMVYHVFYTLTDK